MTRELPRLVMCCAEEGGLRRIQEEVGGYHVVDALVRLHGDGNAALGKLKGGKPCEGWHVWCRGSGAVEAILGVEGDDWRVFDWGVP